MGSFVYQSVEELEVARRLDPILREIDPKGRYFTRLEQAEECPSYLRSRREGSFCKYMGQNISEYLEIHPEDRTSTFLFHIWGRLSDALDLLGKHEIYHLNLSPQTILVGSDGAVTLIGFGQAVVAPTSADKLKILQARHWDETKPNWARYPTLLPKPKALKELQGTYHPLAILSQTYDDLMRPGVFYFYKIDRYSLGKVLVGMGHKWDITVSEADRALFLKVTSDDPE